MDVSITMEKTGYRIKRRRLLRRKVPNKHKVKRENTIKFFKEKYKVEVIE